MNRISRHFRRMAAGRITGLALAGAALLASAPAAAANVTINTAQIKGGTKDTKRLSAYLYHISHADCVNGDWKINIPVSFTPGIGALQFWAAETDNCATTAGRSETGNCKQVYPLSSGTSVYTFTAQQFVGALGITDCTDTSTSTAARTLTLYMLLAGSPETTPGTIDAENYATYPVKIDLIGPNAPTGVNVAPGDGILILSLPTSTDTDAQGYYVFANPNPTPPDDATEDTCSGGTGGTGGTGGSGGSGTTTGTGGTGGMGGTGGTGGTGGAGGSGTGGAGGAAASSSSSSTSSTTTSSTTSSGSADAGADADAGDTEDGGVSTCAVGTTLGCVDLVHPSITSKNRYGSQISRSSTEVVIKDLKNDKPYVVAIAAYDSVNNIGPLSVLQCGTPQPTNTFFNQYCADGGAVCAGGCGSCNVGADRDLAWSGLGAAALAAAGMIARRDRRRRKTSKRDGAPEAK